MRVKLALWGLYMGVCMDLQIHAYIKYAFYIYGPKGKLKSSCFAEYIKLCCSKVFQINALGVNWVRSFSLSYNTVNYSYLHWSDC